MNPEISEKIRQYFSAMSIFKDPERTNSLFAGRNLPAFVKDFLLKRYLDIKTGEINTLALTQFLDKVIPSNSGSVKDKIVSGEEVVLLTRFMINIDLNKGVKQFSVPDYGIKLKEGIIPDYTYNKHKGELVDGEKWGIIKLCLLLDNDGKKYHVQMVEYKPFKPYSSVDINYLADARQHFSTQEWVDVLLSAMEYDPDGFENMTKKMEFLTRLLIFIEPRLNVIELAPKGTGKSYVFGNLSKYGWLVSGGKVTRAKLFYDKQKQQNGIIKNHDFTAFDEIQTITFSDNSEMQSFLKNYLENGRATIDNYEFMSECGLMLLGNIMLSENNEPISYKYFDSLPEVFKESALLDRFHGMIEGWLLPRINVDMALQDWTLNVEFFSEVLHQMRTESIYSQIVEDIVEVPLGADMRHTKAIKRVATAYLKLLFPHVTSAEQVDLNQFNMLCLQPAIRRRDIVRQQCSNIDPEPSFSKPIPEYRVKGLSYE